MIKKLDGQFVVPGVKLGVVEEFMPGRGTTEVDGTVYSAATGVAAVDSTRHIVSVRASAGPPVVPEEGSTIIGVVEKVQEKMAIINIVVVDGHKLQPPFTGMLHISNSSPRFGRYMGVINAYCSRCGGELVLSGRILRCTLCLNVERRRLAEDFGVGGNVPS